jgi:hypothetical protein
MDKNDIEGGVNKFSLNIEGRVNKRHKTRQNKKRNHKTRTRDLWNTRREIQTQTKLGQPS